eukprot:TRINITY_DN41117_c0_g1_i1.p1 TRINITY_DN41117_c0_g1~~TRINITY_DN41117_c0_g1_i1.p1  ORF type:complete len:517 (-),score=66.82 TRINITY_DN41117_c0_g1_i1:15-1565(-)
MPAKKSPKVTKSFGTDTRVEVKFFDESATGASWYPGTITGFRGGLKYGIDYDQDDEVTSIDLSHEEVRVMAGKRRGGKRPGTPPTLTPPKAKPKRKRSESPSNESTSDVPKTSPSPRGRKTAAKPARAKAKSPEEQYEPSDSSFDEEEEKKPKKKAGPAKKRAKRSDSEGSDDHGDFHHKAFKRKHKRGEMDAKRQKLLDELLKKLPDAVRERATAEKWSDAKVKSYTTRDANPNEYFYRHLAEGEEPRSGGFSREEEEKLTKLCIEQGINKAGSRPRWGLLSRHFPGRVGYACSAAYRKLVDSKKIHDENYIFDENGRSKYLFKGGAKKEGKQVTRSTSNRYRGKKRKGSDDERIFADEVSDQSEGEWDVSKKHFGSTINDWVAAAGSATASIDNPLPNYIDQITGDIVVQPCISDRGYVAGRRTWFAALESNGKCPWTNVRMSHRSLVALTLDNIDEYRDNIRNWDGPREIALSSFPVSDPLAESKSGKEGACLPQHKAGEADEAKDSEPDGTG